jgi:nitrate reductase NapAB chaperone NapD
LFQIRNLEKCEVKIYSIEGKLVKILNVHNQFETTLNNGSYILCIDYSSGKHIRKKIII